MLFEFTVAALETVTFAPPLKPATNRPMSRIFASLVTVRLLPLVPLVPMKIWPKVATSVCSSRMIKFNHRPSMA